MVPRATERLPGLTSRCATSGRRVAVDTRVAVRLAVSAPLPDGTTYRNQGVQWLHMRWGRMTDDWVLEDTVALQRPSTSSRRS